MLSTNGLSDNCVVLQIEQYAVDFVQHQMEPLTALNTTTVQQVLDVFVAAVVV